MSRSDDVDKLDLGTGQEYTKEYTVPLDIVCYKVRPRDLYRGRIGSNTIGFDIPLKSNRRCVQSGRIYFYATNEHHPDHDKYDGSTGFFRNLAGDVGHPSLMTSCATVWELGMEEFEHG